MARPTFQVTEKLSEKVKMLASVGVRQEEIAKVLDITPKTLRKHFRRELDTGAIEANAEVAQTLYRMATSGTHPAASIFWVKARCGWRENAPVEEKKQPKTPETSGRPGLPGFAVNLAEQSEREPLA
jgi:predicted transcriptional regulator